MGSPCFGKLPFGKSATNRTLDPCLNCIMTITVLVSFDPSLEFGFEGSGLSPTDLGCRV